MERHRHLYKNNLMDMSPRKPTRRAQQAMDRTNHRSNMYSNNRDFGSNDMSTNKEENGSDERSKTFTLKIDDENMESVVLFNGNSKKALNYIRRYKQWKEDKEQEKTKKVKPARPPFMPVGKSTCSLTSAASSSASSTATSFAPPNHKFKAPVVKKSGVEKKGVEKTAKGKSSKLDNGKELANEKDENKAAKPLLATMKPLKPTINTEKVEFKQFAMPRKAPATARPKRDVTATKTIKTTKTTPSDTANKTVASKGGAVGKARVVQPKSVVEEKNLRSKLTVNMKAKKVAPTAVTKAKAKRAVLKPNAQLLLMANAIVPTPPLITPVDHPIVPTKFVTSTLVRPATADDNGLSLGNKEFNGLTGTLSPIVAPSNAHERNDAAPPVAVKRDKPPMKKKFNFLRMDPNVSLLDSPQASKTPRRETLIRTKCATEWPVEVQHTLDAVAQFRQMLANQIARLHAQCDEWEAYKTANSELMLETCGGDMIDVTIGQTKLLTSKKFMQFQGLIDRCERGAKGEGPVDDGSENTKPITAVDLDGFWSMLDLQVCDLDERFRQLKVWKVNNWTEPNVPKVPVKKVKKTIKSSATNNVAANVRPSAGLQQMLRRIHKENMKSKRAQGNNDTLVESSPHSNRNRSQLGAKTPSSSQRRVTLLVRDRKSFSRTPTIITMTTPMRRIGAATIQNDDNEPKLSPAIARFKRNMSGLRDVYEELQRAQQDGGGNENLNDTKNGDAHPFGVYKLRGREVALRSSNEIVIPR